jgi:hypothetical protein
VLGLDKELVEALWRYIRSNVERKNGRASLLDGVPVQIGGEDLERKVLDWLSCSSASLKMIASE